MKEKQEVYLLHGVIFLFENWSIERATFGLCVNKCFFSF